MEFSNLHKARYGYQPKLPAIFKEAVSDVVVETGDKTRAVSDHEELGALFKHSYGKPLVRFVKGRNEKTGCALNVGVILSGGQAPGGHNVIAGLFDGLKKGNSASLIRGHFIIKMSRPVRFSRAEQVAMSCKLNI